MSVSCMLTQRFLKTILLVVVIRLLLVFSIRIPIKPIREVCQYHLVRQVFLLPLQFLLFLRIGQFLHMFQA